MSRARRHVINNRRPDRRGPPPPDFEERVLDLLAAEGPLSTRGISERLHLDRMKLPAWLGVLREQGLVENSDEGRHSTWSLAGERAGAGGVPDWKRALEALGRRGGLTRNELAKEIDVLPLRASIVLQNLRVREEAVCVGLGVEAAWFLPGAVPPATSAAPCLEPGSGPKLDCVKYDGCLSEYLRQRPTLGSAPARCPAACAHFAAYPKLLDLAAATVQRRGRMEAA